MTRLPDLVGDSNLETHFVSDNSLETIHIYHESDPTSRRRVVARSEHWKRLRRIGGGGYSTVWLEECSQGSRNGIKVRAVKQIETGGRFNRIDFNRELETIAKFSHPRVYHAKHDPKCAIPTLTCQVPTMLRRVIRMVSEPRASLDCNGVSRAR